MATLSEVLRLLPDASKNAGRQWAAYSMLYLPLAASAANTKGSVATQDNSDFILMRIKAYVTDTATPPVENTTPQATLTLQIGDSQMFPDGNAVHIQNFAVSAADRRGHELEFPVRVPRSTNLVCFMSNLTATQMNVRLVFFGLRVYGTQAPRATDAL